MSRSQNVVSTGARSQTDVRAGDERAPEAHAREEHAGGADAVEQAVRAAIARLAPGTRLVLAVSGGRDSMVLLDAMARWAPERIAGVATYDHGTGPAATRASARAARQARALGLTVHRGRASQPLRTEAQWRDARWSFLAAVARRASTPDAAARVATAHSRDDQVETVLMRAMRGAGARGLAGLAAPSPALRPLLAVSGEEIRAYAARRGLSWVEDPSNHDRRHLRNRIRLDLLPALQRADPSLATALVALGERAAALRGDVDAIIRRGVRAEIRTGRITVARPVLASYDAQALGLLWPALAAEAGIRLDRRGTARLARFTVDGRNGGEMQLAGGIVVRLHRDVLTVGAPARAQGCYRLATLRDGTRLGRFQFVVHEVDPAAGPALPPTNADLWELTFPSAQPLTVRAWRPGDRMIPHGATAPRRVKGVLRDAGVPGSARPGWPVVLAGPDVVWVPGVRRGRAATARPGRPLVRYRCERLD